MGFGIDKMLDTAELVALSNDWTTTPTVPTLFSINLRVLKDILPGQPIALRWDIGIGHLDARDLGTAVTAQVYLGSDLLWSSTEVPLKEYPGFLGGGLSALQEVEISPPADSSRSVYQIGLHNLQLKVTGNGKDPGPYTALSTLYVLGEAIDGSWWEWSETYQSLGEVFALEAARATTLNRVLGARRAGAAQALQMQIAGYQEKSTTLSNLTANLRATAATAKFEAEKPKPTNPQQFLSIVNTLAKEGLAPPARTVAQQSGLAPDTIAALDVLLRDARVIELYRNNGLPSAVETIGRSLDLYAREIRRKHSQHAGVHSVKYARVETLIHAIGTMRFRPTRQAKRCWAGDRRPQRAAAVAMTAAAGTGRSIGQSR
ncbi:MAG: hypothetical protein LAQ69_19115 [Acidobacteriia bacterium]|nr:hypothetical protein [Terriglobia bacterium]